MLAEQEGMCSFKRVCSIPFSDEPLRTRLLREEVQVVPLAGNPTLGPLPCGISSLVPWRHSCPPSKLPEHSQVTGQTSAGIQPESQQMALFP